MKILAVIALFCCFAVPASACDPTLQPAFGFRADAGCGAVLPAAAFRFQALPSYNFQAGFVPRVDLTPRLDYRIGVPNQVQFLGIRRSVIVVR